MGYRNPIPVLLDEYVSKKVTINFTFEKYVTTEEAAKGIGELIQKNGGVIPENWIHLVDPKDCVDKAELQED